MERKKGISALKERDFGQKLAKLERIRQVSGAWVIGGRAEGANCPLFVYCKLLINKALKRVALWEWTRDGQKSHFSICRYHIRLRPTGSKPRGCGLYPLYRYLQIYFSQKTPKNGLSTLKMELKSYNAPLYLCPFSRIIYILFIFMKGKDLCL